jgi:hypothetical protein
MFVRWFSLIFQNSELLIRRMVTKNRTEEQLNKTTFLQDRIKNLRNTVLSLLLNKISGDRFPIMCSRITQPLNWLIMDRMAGVKFLAEAEIFCHRDQTALRPTQLPIQWIPQTLSPVIKCYDYHLSPSSIEVKNARRKFSMLPIRSHGVVLSHKGNFTFRYYLGPTIKGIWENCNSLACMLDIILLRHVELFFWTLSIFYIIKL